MANTILNAKINFAVEGAAESVANLKKIEKTATDSVSALEDIRRKAQETSNRKGGFNWEGVEESAKKAAEALDKVRVAQNALTEDMEKAGTIEEGNRMKMYGEALSQVANETRKNLELQRQREEGLARFNEQMGRTDTATKGVIGSLQNVRAAFDSQEQGIKKVLGVGGALVGLYQSIEDGVDVIQGSGNVFEGLRLAIAGTSESGNKLVGFLDTASEKFRYLQNVVRYGMKFTTGIGEAEQLRKSLDAVQGSTKNLQDSLKGVEGVNFASLSQAMVRASNNAKTLAVDMRTSGDVNQKAYRNTREEIERVIEKLQELRIAAASQFGDESEQVGAVDAMIKRYKELDRETYRIKNSYTGMAESSATFMGINLTKLPIVGKHFANLAEKTKETTEQISKTAEKTLGIRRAAEQVAGPVSQLGTTLNYVNQDLQTAQYGFSGLSQSMVASVAVVGGLAGALGGLDPAFSAVIGGAAAMAQQMIASFNMMTSAASSSDKLKASLTGLGAILTGFGATAVGSMVSLGKYAAEVESQFVGLKVTARNAGVPLDIVNEKIEQLRDTGIQTDVAISSLMQFLKAELPIDQVNSLAGAAQDLAKSLGQNSSETLQRFIYFVQTGNSALLDAVGIAKNASVMYEEYAATIGKTGRTLTTLEQRQALINGLMQEAAGVSGIYAEAAKTVGGQLQSMKRHFNELRLEIGKEFQPILLEIVSRFTGLLKSLRAMSPETKRMIGFITSLVAVFGSLLGVILLLAPSIGSLIGVVTALGLTINTLFPVFGLLTVAIVGLLALFKSIPSESEGVAGVAEKLGYVLDKLSQTLKSIAQGLGDFFRPFIELINYHMPKLEYAFSSFMDRLRETFAGLQGQFTIIQTLTTVFKDLAAILWHIINNVLYALEAALNQDWAQFWRRIGDAGNEALTGLVEVFTGLIPQAFEWGRDMIFSFGRGLLESAKAAIPSVMNYVGGILGDFLQTHSPARKGALKNIVKWGAGAASSFASGMGAGQTAISRGIGSFGGAFAGMSVQAKEWGKNLTGTFAEGIASQAGKAIVPAMDTVGGMIGRFLKGASPPPEGVLSDIDQWGKTAFETFLSGFEMADFSVFDKAMGLVGNRLDNLYSSIKEKGSLVASALLEARQVMAEGISGVRGGTLSLNDFAGLADRIATPVRDIFDVITKVLQAEAAQAEVQALQDSIEAAREARRETIEAQQDRIKAIQKSMRDLQKEEKRIQKSIETEAKARIEQMGIVIDMSLLNELKRRLETASAEVKRSQLTLEKVQSARERYGINLISWEEINAMAALNLAQQREEEAKLAVDAEEAKQKQLEDIKKEIQEEKNPELEALRERMELLQERAEAEQDKLAELQDAEQAITREEDKRLKAAQRHAQELAKQAQLAEAALKERLEQEKLLAEAAKAQADETAETVNVMKEAKRRTRFQKKTSGQDTIYEPEAPAESGLLGMARSIMESANSALQAVGEAAYGMAADVLGLFGIDLDQVVAGLQPLFTKISEQWEEVKKAAAAIFQDPELQAALQKLGEAFAELGKALGLDEGGLANILGFLGKALVALPFVLVLAVLKLLTGALKIITPLITFFANAWTWTITQLTKFIKFVKPFIGTIIGFFEGLYNKLVGKSIIPDLINGIIEWFWKLPKLVAGAIGAFLSSILGPLGNLVKDAGAKAGEVVNSILTPINDLASNVPEVVITVATSGMEAAQSLIDGVRERWNSLVTSAISTTKALYTQGMETGGQAIRDVSSAWDVFRASTSNIYKTLTTQGLDAAVTQLIDGIRAAWVTFSQTPTGHTISVVANGITDALRSTIGGIRDNWSGLVSSVGQKIITLLPSGMTDFLAGIMERIRIAWASITGLLSVKNISLYLGGLFSNVTSVIEDIVDLFERVVNAWRTFLGLDTTATTLNVQLDPGSLNPLTFPNLDIDLERLQSGGIALRKVLSLIGEAGPEAVIPLSRLPQVLSNLGGGDTINRSQVLTYAPVLNFYGTPDPGRVRREVVRAGEDWAWEFRR